MISEGANALQVKRRMGHEDIRTTYNVYGTSLMTMRTPWLNVWTNGPSVGPEVLGIC